MLPKAPFREYAGVMTAFMVVLAYVTIGFVSMISGLLGLGPVSAPADWSAAMLSLASAAMGFLIGKQVGLPDSSTTTVTTGAPPTIVTTTQGPSPVDTPPAFTRFVGSGGNNVGGTGGKK
jgi:hypothetical protein